MPASYATSALKTQSAKKAGMPDTAIESVGNLYVFGYFPVTILAFEFLLLFSIAFENRRYMASKFLTHRENTYNTSTRNSLY